MSKVTIRRTLALTGTAAALTALVSAPASAEPAPARSSGTAVAEKASYVTMRFVLNGKYRCVDVPKASKKRGVRLQLWNCTGKSNQQWGTYHSKGPGSIRPMQIYNRNSRLCVNVERASKSSGARIIQWPCSWKHNNGLWYAEANGKGYHLRNARSGQCLTVGDNSTRNGAWLIQWPCRKNLASQRVYIR